MLREPKKSAIEGSAKLVAKPSRFRIVKLEERIAPGNGNGNGSNATCGNIATCHCTHGRNCGK